ncbi:hypothetical protein Ddc_19243 [Ditylenchus destructor]|nr:hypothetical protein Ddc_19243 [Ditylenchus destructor]
MGNGRIRAPRLCDLRDPENMPKYGSRAGDVKSKVAQHPIPNNFAPITFIEAKRRRRKRRSQANYQLSLERRQLKRPKNKMRYVENLAECPEYQGCSSREFTRPIADASAISGQCTFESYQCNANNPNTQESGEGQTAISESGNSVAITRIQPDNGSSRGDEPNLNVTLLENIEEQNDSGIKTSIVNANPGTAILNDNTERNSEIRSECQAAGENEIDLLMPSVPFTESVVETQQNVTDPITNSANTSALNAKILVNPELLEISTVPIGLRLEAALSSNAPIDVVANEAQHNSVAITTTHISRRKRSNVSSNSVGSSERSAWKSIAPDSSTDSDDSHPASKMIRESLELLPSTSASTLPAQRSSKQSSANNSNGDKNEKGEQSIQNLTAPAQVALHDPTGSIQEMKITKIWIDIGSGSTSFKTTDQEHHQKYHNRPLCEYVSILRQSEAIRDCKVQITYSLSLSLTLVNVGSGRSSKNFRRNSIRSRTFGSMGALRLSCANMGTKHFRYPIFAMSYLVKADLFWRAKYWKSTRMIRFHSQNSTMQQFKFSLVSPSKVLRELITNKYGTGKLEINTVASPWRGLSCVVIEQRSFTSVPNEPPTGIE